MNLAHLRHNLRVLERALITSTSSPPDGSGGALTGAPDPSTAQRASAQDAAQRAPVARAAIWGVLKADAYGHGASAVARTLERAGIPGLCVALLEEAVELRSAGIQIPILVMGGYYGLRRDGFEAILDNDLIPVVYDAEQIERIAALVRSEGSRAVSVHLKVDTGMGRLGIAPSEVDEALRILARCPEVHLDGLMTHFACADSDDLAPTWEQLRRFAEIEQRARAMGLTPRVRHAANSAAMLRVADARFDLVRPGVALFGVAPKAGLAPELKPVMRVRSEVVALRWVPKGESIGYGHTWKAERDSHVATVPMGYADGLSRQLSNRGHALVRGRRAPIAGTVSMDLTMIDVTDVPGARSGDEAVFLGHQEGPLGREVITAEEIAAHAGTIPWEVLTSVSRRVPRFYREP